MQGGHKKLKPGLAASYDIRSGNGEGLFLFGCFMNLLLTYLLRHPPTYSIGTHMGQPVPEKKQGFMSWMFTKYRN